MVCDSTFLSGEFFILNTWPENSFKILFLAAKFMQHITDKMKNILPENTILHLCF